MPRERIPKYRIKNGSGSGPDEYPIDPMALASALGPLTNNATPELVAELQSAINAWWFWRISYDKPDATPIIRFYRKAAKALEEARRIIEAGPDTDDDDVSWISGYAFNTSRRFQDDDELIRLGIRLGFASKNFEEAEKCLIEKHCEPDGKPGPKRTDVEAALVERLFRFCEKNRFPSRVYYDPKNEDRYTPFVQFFDNVRELLAQNLPEASSKSETLVKGVIDKIKENRQARTQADEEPQ